MGKSFIFVFFACLLLGPQMSQASPINENYPGYKPLSNFTDFRDSTHHDFLVNHLKNLEKPNATIQTVQAGVIFN